MPRRNPLVVLGSVFAAFTAGPLLGTTVAHWTAPGSEIAQVVSPLALALAFAGGLLLWFGAGTVSLVGKALRRLLRGRRERRRAPAKGETLVPPGCGAFVPVAVALGLLAGVVAGSSAESGSFWSACAAHAAAGAGYGLLLRSLARQGYLPFPEPS